MVLETESRGDIWPTEESQARRSGPFVYTKLVAGHLALKQPRQEGEWYLTTVACGPSIYLGWY